MEVSGDLHASGTQAGWIADPLWTFGEETALLCLSRIKPRIFGSRVRRLEETLIGLQGHEVAAV
jgi:hypothetical protein